MSIFNLNSLQLEGAENRPQNLQSISPVPDKNEDELIISFSARLVNFLRGKAKEHNKNFPKKKTTLNKLKEVYKRGSNSCEENSVNTRGELATARVNMFLGLLSGNKAISRLEKASITNASGLDVTELWSPSREDFAKASFEIKENDLNYNFLDVNNLYLDEESSGLSLSFEA